MIRPARSALIAAACGFLLGLHQALAAVVMTNQAFDVPPWTNTSSFVNTNVSGWRGTNILIDKGGVIGPPASPPRCIWLNDYDANTNSAIRFPLLTNGVGIISFAHCLAPAGGSNIFIIEGSTNVGTNWFAWKDTITNNIENWTTNVYTNIYYTPITLRFRKKWGATISSYLGLDNISIYYPPAKVIITNCAVALPVFSETPANVTATLLQSGVISNLTASNFWVFAGVTNSIRMTNLIGGDVWQTETPIPGKPAGNTIYYYATAFFQGPDAMSPSSSSTSQYTVVERPFLSGLSSLTLTGSFTVGMFQIADYTWQGVAVTTGVASIPSMGFRAATTNIPPTTNAFGDNDQSDYELLIEGVAETDGWPIVVSTTNTGQFIVYFNETNLMYSVNHGYHNNFEDWTTGLTTNNGWTMTNGAVLQDGVHLRNGYCAHLGSNKLAYLQTPYLAQGVGEVAFWYRHFATSGVPANVQCQIQKSITGSTNAADWTTITNLSFNNIAFNRFITTVEDRNSRYVRLLSFTNNATICLDEAQVADPYYSGLVFSNLTHAPASPTATNPVTVSIEIYPRGGASNLQATLYFRSGTNGVFTNTVMTNTTGNIYTNPVPIPLYFGPSNGAGIVQYFVGCTHEGFQSGFTSPSYYLPGGSNNASPQSFVIQSAYVFASNLVLTPSPPIVNTPLQADITITPYAAASNIAPRFYYRFGGSGPIITNFVTMSPAGGFQFSGAIPIPSTILPGTPLFHYVNIPFVGPDAATPTNWPAGGSNTPLIAYFRAIPPTSIYSNMEMTGSFTGAMFLASNNFWQGVATVASAPDPAFLFHGTGPGSDFLGDSTQKIFNLPVHGVADDLGGSSIVVTGVQSGNFFVQYNATNHIYSVRRCAYLNFENPTWTDAAPTNFGEHTNAEAWVLSNARSTTNTVADLERSFIGWAGVLNSNASSYILSPFMSNGVGEINFWFRNWETGGTVYAGFTIETAPDVTGTWTRIANVTNALNQQYQNFMLYLSDRDSHYVRFLNTTNAGRPFLCLDEIMIAEPAAGVVFTNVSIAPANPTILNSVTVTVYIAAMSGATNLAARLWYRSGTNGLYETMLMKNPATNRFVSTNAIVRAPVGVVNYFFECFYEGLLAEKTSPLYYLPYSSNNPAPLSYSVADLIRTQSFDTANWGNTPGIVFVNTNNSKEGWSGGSVRISVDDYLSAPRSCWLAALIDYPNTWIRSQLCSNGVGTVYFAYRNMAAGQQNDFLVEVSTNVGGSVTNFISKGTFTCTSDAWATGRCEILSYPPTYVRLRKTSDSGTDPYLYLDNFIITYAPAMTAISNVMIHPGYPSTNDVNGPSNGVFVTCDIGSENPFFPPYDVTPYVLWRNGGAGPPWSSPIPMRRYEGGYFASLTGIPSQRRDSTVYYLITNDFKGYYYQGFLGTNECRSPDFFPKTGATNYLVRPHRSDFYGFDIIANGAPVQMRQLQDYVWQGILNFTTATNRLDLCLSGSNNYNGRIYVPENTLYGDSAAWKPYVPLSGFAVTNGSNIIVNGDFSEQYVLRFDERSGEYLFQNCVWQDFNTWSLTTNYQSSGNDNAPVISQNFDSWPWTNSPSYSSFDDFSAARWAAVNVYTNESFENEGTWWGILQAKITGGFVETRPTNILGPGSPARYVVFPNTNGYGKGVGTVKFNYRGGSWQSTNVPVKASVWLCPTNLAWNDGDNWQQYWVSSNLTNTASWSTRTNVFNISTTMSVIIYQESGTNSLQIDNVYYSDWYADTKDQGGWLVSECRITTDFANSPPNCCEFDPSRADGPMFIRTPLLTNGVAFFEFYYSSRTTTNPVTFNVLLSSDPDTNTWSVLAAVSNATIPARSYCYYNMTIMTNQPVYLMISNTSPYGSILSIDNIQCSTIATSNSWLIHNAKIDEAETGRVWHLRSAYLNKDGTTGAGPNNFSNINPYLLSPALTNGFGEISFWYRHYGPTTNPFANLIIQKSQTAFTNPETWELVCQLDNIKNTNEYAYFRTSFYDSVSRYIRIVNVTNPPGARVCLDDVLITGPIAADLVLTNLAIIPIQPLYSNRVQVAIDVVDKFLNPSNIVVQAVYSFGNSYTDAISGVPTVLPMTLVSSNLEQRRFSYETITNDYCANCIPTNAIDTWVEYYVICTFNGRHSEGTSPKSNRVFRTPSWYYPVDFGTNHAYYVTFNCPTGRLFFNEVNPIDPDLYTFPYYHYTNEYIEICGEGGVDFKNWSIQVWDYNSNFVSHYYITNHYVFVNQTNGHGFWVIGDVGVPNHDQTFTNSWAFGEPEENLPAYGHLRLVRSMGAYAQVINYGSSFLGGFTPIGGDDSSCFGALHLTGSGTNYSDFLVTGGWIIDDSGWSPGQINSGQTLFGYGSGEEYFDPPSSVIINYIRFVTNSVVIRCNGVTNWWPAPWYSTNLFNTNCWTNVTTYQRTAFTADVLFHINFTVTNPPPVYFKVITTNAP